MAHDWRPCTWRVNDKLETWMLLGRVFEMVCLMDVNIPFVSFSPAVLVCLKASRLSNFCFSHRQTKVGQTVVDALRQTRTGTAVC